MKERFARQRQVRRRIEDFWNKNLCGRHFISARYPSKEFFDQYRELRYRKEHHLNHFVEWELARNRDVLEIGSGVGADGTRWATHAGSYTGIDLTDEAIVATSLHLKLLGLKGNTMKGDAESLPFHDDRFDIVYAHGVLHHVQSIENALREIYRVLRPNGAVLLMLYSKDSLNYWLRIQFYFRLRFLYALFESKLGLHISEPWVTHLRNFQKIGWAYFSWNNWIHHCTDGPDCEIANIYHKNEIMKLLQEAHFVITRMRKGHLPLGGFYPAVERLLARYVGFYQFVWATKE
jgi:ubiquinone/menaquinone biosynthesis C-methylase UbiE